MARRAAATQWNRPRDVFAWLALAPAAVFVALLLIEAPSILSDMYWSSDVTATLVVADRIANGVARGGTTYVTQPIYVVIDLVTAWVPHHDVVWQAIPFVLYVATAALMFLCARRVAGTWGGAVAAAFTIAATSPLVLGTYIAQNFHGTTWFGVALLGFFCVSVAGQRRPLRGAVLVVAVIVAAAAGLLAASDALIIVAGIVPLAAVGLYGLVVRWRTQRLRDAGAIFVGTAIAALLATRLGIGLYMHLGLTASATLPLAKRSQWIGNAMHLAHGFLTVIAGVSTNDHGLLALVAVVAGVVAVAALPFIAFGLWQRRTHLDDSASSSAVFWGASAIAVAGAYVGSSVAADAGTFRYLIPLVLAFWVLLAFVGSVNANTLVMVAVAACIVGLSAVGHLVTYPRSHVFRHPGTEMFPSLIAELNARGLHRGYAEYWLANSISWQTHDRLEILPVLGGCGSPDAGTLCPYLHNVGSSAYRPAPGRSFVIEHDGVDPDRAPSAAKYGRPDSTYRFGAYVVYVYRDDIARRF